MGRIFAGFVIGALGGLVVGNLAWQFVGEARWTAKEMSMPREEFAAWSERLGSAYLAAVTFCGVLGAYFLNRPFGRRVTRTRIATRAGADNVLTPDEFQRIFQVTQWVPTGNGPDYLRGFIVGRLAETAPSLAKKVEGFGDRHMSAVWSDLRYNRVAGADPRRWKIAPPPTDDEIRLIRARCSGFDLHDRSDDYFRGLLVGRLVDPYPMLAWKINDLIWLELAAVRARFGELQP